MKVLIFDFFDFFFSQFEKKNKELMELLQQLNQVVILINLLILSRNLKVSYFVLNFFSRKFADKSFFYLDCEDLSYKLSYADERPFYRMKIKIKEEIVTMGVGGLLKEFLQF